jgi:hypothetical protein
MLGFEIREGVFDGIAGKQATADVYVGEKPVAEFYFPFAKLRAKLFCLLHFWRKGPLPDLDEGRD